MDMASALVLVAILNIWVVLVFVWILTDKVDKIEENLMSKSGGKSVAEVVNKRHLDG